MAFTSGSWVFCLTCFILWHFMPQGWEMWKRFSLLSVIISKKFLPLPPPLRKRKPAPWSHILWSILFLFLRYICRYILTYANTLSSPPPYIKNSNSWFLMLLGEPQIHVGVILLWTSSPPCTSRCRITFTSIQFPVLLPYL